MSNNELWIATVEVEPYEGNDLVGEAIGAFVSVIGMSTDHRDFRGQIGAFMETEGFEILSIADSEPLELRLEFSDISDELEAIAKQAEATGQMMCGTFEAYMVDDEISGQIH